MTKTPLHILQLTIENVKRLSAVSITPDGQPLVVIGGKNGAGKSSVLDAIAYALGGEKLLPAKPVRDGQEKAKSVVVLGANNVPEFVVTRTFTAAGGGSLTVTNASEEAKAKYASPQALLNGLIGSLAFDPLEFTGMEAKRQSDTLLAIAGVDTTILDARIDDALANRRSAARHLSDLEGRLRAYPLTAEHLANAPTQLQDVGVLMDEMRAAEQTLAAGREAKLKLEQAQSHSARKERVCEILRQQRDDLQRQLSNLTTELEHAHAAIVVAKKEEDAAEALLKEARAAFRDPTDVKAKLKTVEAQNELHRAAIVRASLVADVTAASEDHDAKDRAVDVLRQTKVDTLAAAKFPIPELAVTEVGVTYNGQPFEQVSQAERIRASVAIGLALHPRLRILLVRDGSLLDDDSMTALARVAAEHDAQLWVERVASTKDGVSVLIENGEVKA